MPFTTAATDAMLTAETTSDALYASLHTAYSSTGANEVTGGSPSYARVSLSWASPSAGSVALASSPTAFNVPAATTIGFVGFWTAASSGTFQGMGPNGGNPQYAFTCPAANPGVFTAPGSSYSNGTTVVVFPGAGATLPTGFTAGTIYYVVSASGATFELASTSGGSGIQASAAGAGLVQQIVTESFGDQGTFTLTTSTVLALT
jgi:hypothetical protein